MALDLTIKNLLLLSLCAELIPELHLLFITLCVNTLHLFPIYCRLNRTPIIELKIEHSIVTQIDFDLAESSNIIYLGQYDTVSVHNGTAESTIYESFDLEGFFPTSFTEIIVLDPVEQCLKKFDRTTGMQSAFSGTCIYGQSVWRHPTSIIIDRMNSSQYLVTDIATVKAVDVAT